MKHFIIVPVVLLMVALGQTACAAEWTVDKSHSNVGFSVKHLMIATVRGNFLDYDATITFDEKDPSNLSFQGTIQAASINTDNDKRDNHLRSEDFFDVTNYPTLTFKSKKTEKVADGTFKMTGELTIRGVTKEIVLNVEGLTLMVKDPMGNIKTGVMATATINRKDFGLNWNVAIEAGGVLVGEEVKIILEAELAKKVE